MPSEKYTRVLQEKKARQAARQAEENRFADRSLIELIWMVHDLSSHPNVRRICRELSHRVRLGTVVARAAAPKEARQ